jgi:SAM-dependent methyltransferase
VIVPDRRQAIAWLIGLLAAVAVATPVTARAQGATPASRPAPHDRLFPPEDLGLLESPDRALWQKPDEIMDALRIAEGSTVADIGAGAGWFTIQLADRVGPNGVVFAQDVQRQMLEAIKRRVGREGLDNRVRTLLGSGSDPNLPAAALDAVLVVDAYQEVEDRVLFLQNLARALEPNGLIGIVNYLPGAGGPGPPADERVPGAAVEADAAAAGLRVVDRETLPYQYLLVLAR